MPPPWVHNSLDMTGSFRNSPKTAHASVSFFTFISMCILFEQPSSGLAASAADDDAMYIFQKHTNPAAARPRLSDSPPVTLKVARFFLIWVWIILLRDLVGDHRRRGGVGRVGTGGETVRCWLFHSTVWNQNHTSLPFLTSYLSTWLPGQHIHPGICITSRACNLQPGQSAT